MKLDIEYSYDVESIVKVFKNPEMQTLIRFIEVSNKIVPIFKDRQRVDLAIKIYERVGWCKEICSEHTYEELKTFYDGLEPCNLSSKLPLDLPNEFNESEEDDVEEDVEEQDGSTFAKESVSYNADITEDVKQRAEVIKTSNTKRAALKKMKPDVK